MIVLLQLGLPQTGLPQVTLCTAVYARQWALNSAVECHPHTVEVVGSNPTAPTIQHLTSRTSRAFRGRWTAQVRESLQIQNLTPGAEARADFGALRGADAPRFHGIPRIRDGVTCICEFLRSEVLNRVLPMQDHSRNISGHFSTRFPTSRVSHGYRKPALQAQKPQAKREEIG